MTRSRGQMPPPTPPSAGRRQNAEVGAAGAGAHHAEPGWPPLPISRPVAPVGQQRQAAPDPRYAVPQEQQEPGSYYYPDAQHGYDAPPQVPPRQASPSLSEIAAGMRAAAEQQPPPQQQRYGHHGQASYAAPPPRPQARAAPAPAAGLPPMPGDGLRGAQYDEWQRGGDPASYDLGAYGLPARGQPEPAYAPQTARDPRQPAGWQNDDPGYEPYPPHPDDHAAARYRPEQAYRGKDQEYVEEEYEDEEEDEPRRGGKRWLILAALLGSIGLGGGLAYAYKTYIADKAGGKPAIVKASQQPSKSPPENPGGKQFPNQDSRILGKLEQDSGARGSDVDANGVRRVPTITYGRDGSVASNGATPVIPPAVRPNVQVPGMTIVDGYSSGGGSAPPAASVAPPPPPAAVVAPRSNIPPPPAPPAVVARATPPPAAAPATRPVPISPSSGEPPAVAAPAKRPVPTVTGVTGAAAKATSGYVAVLTTRRSRMDALSSFADLQQKYPVLQDKIPDVIEADLTSRNLGTMYRLVVGPPGSRQQVSTLCSQLKSAGYTDCWATQY